MFGVYLCTCVYLRVWVYISFTGSKLFWSLFIFLNKFIYLFIYFWLCWFFAAARGLSLVAASGGYSSLGHAASHCGGFSLWSMGSRCAGFSSCGT